MRNWYLDPQLPQSLGHQRKNAIINGQSNVRPGYSYPSTASPENSNTGEAQVTDLKTNFIKVIEVLKEGKESLKESRERINELLEKMNKFLQKVQKKCEGNE